MKKSKMMKALLVFGMSAITATSIAGFTACDGGHTHNWSWKDDGNGTTHSRECTADGHEGDAKETENHKDNNGDKKCDECGYVMSTTPVNPGPSGPGTGEQDPPSTTKEAVVVDFTANSVAEEDIATDLGIQTTSAIEVKEQNRKVIYNGQTTQLSKGLKMNGAASKTGKSFKVNLSEDATVVVYAASGSGTADTYLSMLNAEGVKDETTIQQVSFNEDTSSAYAHPAIFSVKANTDYYIGSDGTGANAVVFRIVVVYGTFTETKGDLVPAKTATCTEAGNIAYYLTNYGRYLNESEQVVGPKVALQAALKHAYKQDGELVTVPGQKTPGAVNLKCDNDATHVLTNVQLPSLETEGAYTRVTNATDNTKTDYTYEHPTYGAIIKFTADSVDEKPEVLTSYTVNFADATKIPTGTITEAGDKTNKGTNKDITDADGKKTGLTVVNIKADRKAVIVAEKTQGTTTSNALILDGTMAKDKNAIQFVIPEAGTATITVKYFNSNAGRYVKLMDTSGSEITNTSAAVLGKVVINDGATEDGTTTTAGDIVTATITLNVTSDNYTILLGSATNGLWITYVDVQWTVAE